MNASAEGIIYTTFWYKAEYNVLGGIANSSPFRPDTGGEGLFHWKISLK